MGPHRPLHQRPQGDSSVGSQTRGVISFVASRASRPPSRGMEITEENLEIVIVEPPELDIGAAAPWSRSLLPSE